MYADRNSAARDLQAMDAEIHHLSDRQGRARGDRAGGDGGAGARRRRPGPTGRRAAQLERRPSPCRGGGRAADAVVAAELSTLEASRSIEAARLPADLLERYETLRARLGGVGAARLVGNRCDGCHLELPSAEVDRIRHLPPGEVVTCDQCGRPRAGDRAGRRAAAPARLSGAGPRPPRRGRRQRAAPAARPDRLAAHRRRTGAGSRRGAGSARPSPHLEASLRRARIRPPCSASTCPSRSTTAGWRSTTASTRVGRRCACRPRCGDSGAPTPTSARPAGETLREVGPGCARRAKELLPGHRGHGRPRPTATWSWSATSRPSRPRWPGPWARGTIWPGGSTSPTAR